MTAPKPRHKKILITGGAGFIGSSLIGELIEDNEITVLDSMRRNSLRFKLYSEHPNLRIVVGDVLDYGQVEEIAQGHQIIVHAAGIAGIDTVIKSPTTTMNVNLIGTANVLKVAKSLTDLQRVVIFSTSEVFGSHAFRSTENDTTVLGAVGEARWTYAVSKLAGEHLAYAYYKEFLVPIVIIRPFNVYGPGQVGEGAIHTFVKQALRNENLVLHGDGNQIRAWCYIDDFVRGLIACIVHPKAVGESFNIGNSRSVITVYGLAQTIVKALNSKSKIVFDNRDYVDIELRVPQVQKAKQILGFEAVVDLEEGILRTAEYYRRNGDKS